MTNTINCPHDGLEPQASFCEDRLNSPPTEHVKSLCANKSIKAAVKSFSEAQAAAVKVDYELLAVVLNKISAAVKRKCLTKNDALIEFVVVESKTMDHHPYGTVDCSPDVIAVLSSNAKALKKAKTKTKAAAKVEAKVSPGWHHILSLAEERQEVDTEAEVSDCGTYLGLANQSRPDMVGMFGLAVSVDGYSIRYSCPAGMETSTMFGWDNLEPLILYMYTLYSPRTDQAYYDDTITLALFKGLSSITDPPKWDVRAGNKVYRHCTVKAVGHPWDRMSWVAQTPADGDTPPIIIKDNFLREGWYYRERDIYRVLQGGKGKGNEGVAPGFAIYRGGFDVKNGLGANGRNGGNGEGKAKVIRVTVRGCKSIKTRLILATSGDPLSSCPTVVTFLKVMYDILEAHRWAVDQRCILHRDISHANIVINPVDAGHVPPFVGKVRPKFITEVLDKTQKSAPPLGRLIDLEGSAKFPNDGDITGPKCELDDDQIAFLQSRVGTRRFIARSVSSERILPENKQFVPMPMLGEDALECYQLAYSAGTDPDPLRTFSDAGTTHGGTFDQKAHQRHDHAQVDRQNASFVHRPCHDAESAFWCIATFLLQALPKGADPNQDAHNAQYNELWAAITRHENDDLDSQDSIDSRNAVLSGGADGGVDWKSALHEELVPVGRLLKELASQVCPEYALLEPRPPPLHLHEAMQRILFKYIWKFGEEGYDVELTTGRTRATVGDEIDSERQPPASAVDTRQSALCDRREEAEEVAGVKRPVEAVLVNELRRSKRARRNTH